MCKFYLSAVILFLVSSLTSASPTPPSSVGELELNGASGRHNNALLINTAISGQVDGMIASITIDQQFENPTDEWVNGRYVFPLPEGAAVDSLQIKIGDRLIKGVIKPKEDAKKAFEKAKKTGKKAGLLAQHRPNLFSMSVANIGPHERVSAQITFIDKVHFENNIFSLSLPTTLTPRYIPGAPIKMTDEQSEHLKKTLESGNDVKINGEFGWAHNTSSVLDASDITPSQSYGFGVETTHRFSLALRLNAGLNLHEISSNTHAIVSSGISADSHEVSLANATELMDGDLELKWQTILDDTPTAALFQQKHAGSYYTMLLLTPPQIEANLSLPRDTIFIIDSSGSMAGESMHQAKQALLEGLSFLGSTDKFNIIDFDSDFHALFEQSQAVNRRSLDRARSMVRNLVADGGTEMIGALKFAFSQNSREQAYLQQIVFITDGAIGNENELFKLIKTELGDSRLFTIGIGSAPNSFFMSKAAKHGGGSYTYIRETNQVKSKMADLFAKISKPQMRDIKLEWSGKVEQFPERISDLYSSQPISVLVKSDKALRHVNASGSLLSQPWKQTLKLGKILHDSNLANNLDAIWARAKISDLMDKLSLGELAPEHAKDEITKLGVSHSIVTKFTSLVAVEETPSKPRNLKATHKNIANLMPKGSTMAIPQTATPATLLSLLGSLMVLLGCVIRRRQHTRTSSRSLEA